MTHSLRAAGGGGPVVLSVNILLVGLIFCGLGFGLGAEALEGSGAAFAFVMSGWVLSLCLHAFGDALYLAVLNLRLPAKNLSPGSGAVVLDPARAPNPVATLVLPMAFTILAGIGFPGGVSEAPARPMTDLTRGQRSAMAAAGPATSAVCLMAFVVLYTLASAEAETLRAVLAVLVLFQGTALILSLMPLPGLDGYGILRPWLPGAWPWADRIARHSSLVLLGLFLLSGAFSRLLFRASLRLTAGLGIDLADVITGYRLVRLW